MTSFRERMKNTQEAANFTHEFVEVPPLRQVNTPNGRYYESEDGKKYFSVTTFLSKDKDKKKGLDAWRNAVGHKEADGIANSSADRGENLHTIFERYLGNEKNYLKDASPITKSMFYSLKPHLDENIDKIYGLELKLYSDYLKSAGTSDVICSWSGKNTILDFKNSRKHKTLEHVQGYFMQSSAYAEMFEDRTGIPITQFVIAIACQDGTTQIFHGKRDDYIQEYKKFVDQNYDDMMKLFS